VQVRLVITNRRSGSLSEHVNDLPITIGRVAQFNTIVVADAAVSRQHARLEHDGENLVLVDLNSANGTFVNRERIQRRALRADDQITIGANRINWSYIEVATGTSLIAPARQAVEAAQTSNRQQGHELDGFLSVEHGFLPEAPPLLALPTSHHAWDEMVDRMPELFSRLDLRQEFDRIPVLDATREALPDRYLLRASTMLGIFAHAYQYAQTEPPAALPPAILGPWREVSRRLGKDVPNVSYIDLFFYNWKLRDQAGPRRLDNMDLLVPAWGNEAERIFYLVTTEFAMQLTPVLEAMIRAQEAVLREDRDALEGALLGILEQLRFVTQVIYPQIDPNPLSASYLDQVLWAKTVGTAGVPIFDGAPSPAGTAQPQTHALDAFFERKSYHSMVGQQSIAMAEQFPRHWTDLISALRQVSVRQFVERSQNTALRGLYNAALDAYIGDRGWMGLHRIKAYGFLEVAFKVGRSVTTGAKFTGLFRDKTWEKIDQELSEVRDERWPAGNQQVYFGRPRRGEVTLDPSSGAPSSTPWTTLVEIDVTGQGMHYEPGDRLGVLAENDEVLVRKTLRALRATGDEIVHLTAEWQEAVRFRAGHTEGVEVLPLRVILAFGKIRPVTRVVAKRLLAHTAAGALKRIVDARMEDQWELWDLLDILRSGGYDVTRLWSAGPSDAESICRVVPPEVFRLYSIASAMSNPTGAGPTKGAEKVSLVVGGLTYTTPRTSYSYEQARTGTASHFLRRMTSDSRYRSKQLSLTVVPTPRFRLPADPSRPVLMFAAGSGIAPFYGFLQARAQVAGTGENRLFFGLRRPEEFVNRPLFERLAADGRLDLRMAFSQADTTARFDADAGQYVLEKGRRQRVNQMIEASDQAASIWDFVRSESEGGRHGYFYICGSSGFAASVMTALTNIVRENSGRSEAEVALVIRRMIAEGRLGLDIFTTYQGHAQQGETFDISSVIMRNTVDAGQWMIVSGKVYDMGEFMHQHVGGPQIVQHYLGMDATSAYEGVLHHVNSEVDAMLGMYELGKMHRLHFEDAWSVALTPDGLRFVPLETLFTTWVRYTYLVVAMENALVNDYGFAAVPATRGADPAEVTPFTLQYLIEAHRRFLVSYLDGLIDEDLSRLWELTVGFCAPDVDIRWLGTEVETMRSTPAYRLVRDSVPFIAELLPGRRQLDPPRTNAETVAMIATLAGAFESEDRRALLEIKTALRDGIRAFEQHQASVVPLAGQHLMKALRQILTVVSDYYRRLGDRLEQEGISLAAIPGDVQEQAVPEDRGMPGHGGPTIV
jgi:sulfite reductase alpha subunit-like flavoprotein